MQMAPLSPLSSSNRGDKTPIELFVAGAATVNMVLLRHFVM
jgi:hypothetical protein